MKAVMEGNIWILPRNNEVADIFLGSGWDNHSVFKMEGGKPKHVNGPMLTEVQFRFVRKAMAAR